MQKAAQGGNKAKQDIMKHNHSLNLQAVFVAERRTDKWMNSRKPNSTK
jgi:hypothetical protein